ncbi:MAG: ABC transporter ATP-binding protein [Deltaproteobacteria bacterium]|nr:ABC transporter ATP-binding protein [Deltaproteobacteria bacterium]
MTPAVPAVRLHRLEKEFVPSLTLGAILTLRRRRERVQAVRGIDLEVPPGSIHAFVGPNGAGKTTVLKLVAALLQPTRGEVEVMGARTVADPERVRAAVGYCITESRSFFLRISGRENLRFFATLHGLYGAVRSRRVDEVVAGLELADVADRHVLSYSEGMKQRLALARALIHHPRVLLLDEIGRGLDPRLREKTYRTLRDDLVGRDGVTVLMASHNMDEVAALADRVSVMEGGVVVASGTYQEVRPRVEEVFRVR